MKLLLCLSLLFLAGCAHVKDRPVQYYGHYAGKCWNFDAIQKKAAKKGYCGKMLFYQNKLYACNRAPHGGWHHAHFYGEDCVVMW